MKKNILLLFFCCVSFQGYSVYASIAETGAKALLLSASARESAMGNACAALNDSVNAINFNPAGIAGLNNVELGFQHTSWLLDTRYEYFAFLCPSEFGAAAFSLTYVDYGSFIRRNEVGFEKGEFKSDDFIADISYAAAVSKRINAGVRIRYLRQKIDEFRSHANPLDVGLIYKVIPEQILLGFSVQNIGARTSRLNTRRERLPVKMRLGASVMPMGGSMLLNLETSIIDGEDSFFSAGTELRACDYIMIRAGGICGSAYDKNIVFSMGVGLCVCGYSLDYAFESFGQFDNCHKISMRVKF